MSKKQGMTTVAQGKHGESLLPHLKEKAVAVDGRYPRYRLPESTSLDERLPRRSVFSMGWNAGCSYN